MNFTTVYSALATTAVVGIAAPVLLPLDMAIKTGFLAAGTACSGILTGLHWSGEASRQFEWERQKRASILRVQQSLLTSWELRQTQRHELEDLREVLLMLDECTPSEQVYFLKKLDLLELLPVYRESAMLKAAELPAPVDVVPTPVELPFAGDTKLKWAVESVIAQSSAPDATQSNIVDDAFEEVDLGRALAEMMVGGDVPLSVILACPPRSGKTSLLTVTLAWLHKLTEGNADVRIYNGKENRDPKTGELRDRFLGLVDDPKRYQAVESLTAAKEFAEEFDKITGQMGQPRQYPEVVFLDEHNNIRARINGYDQMNGLARAKSYLNKTDVNVGLVGTQGSSRGLYLLISSHSAYVKNIGIDRSYQDGFYSIVLGRGGALDGLYKSLRGANAVVQNVTRAKQIELELQAWEQSPTRDHSKVVALTNLIDGNFGLYFVKHIDLSKVSFEPIASGSPAAPDPYEFWDSEFEEDFGHQPENDPNWKSPSIPTGSPLAMLIESLKQWIATLPSAPTDDALQSKLTEMTGKPVSKDALIGIKKELGL